MSRTSIEVAPRWNDWAAHRTLLRERADFGHQVVADFPFDLLGALDIDAVLSSPQIGNLRRRHQPRFELSLRKATQTRRNSLRFSASLQMRRITSLP